MLGFSKVCEGAWHGYCFARDLNDTMLMHREGLYRGGHSAADLVTVAKKPCAPVCILSILTARLKRVKHASTFAQQWG